MAKNDMGGSPLYPLFEQLWLDFAATPGAGSWQELRKSLDLDSAALLRETVQGLLLDLRETRENSNDRLTDAWIRELKNALPMHAHVFEDIMGALERRHRPKRIVLEAFALALIYLALHILSPEIQASRPFNDLFTEDGMDFNVGEFRQLLQIEGRRAGKPGRALDELAILLTKYPRVMDQVIFHAALPSGDDHRFSITAPQTVTIGLDDLGIFEDLARIMGANRGQRNTIDLSTNAYNTVVMNVALGEEGMAQVDMYPFDGGMFFMIHTDLPPDSPAIADLKQRLMGFQSPAPNSPRVSISTYHNLSFGNGQAVEFIVRDLSSIGLGGPESILRFPGDLGPGETYFDSAEAFSAFIRQIARAPELRQGGTISIQENQNESPGAEEARQHMSNWPYAEYGTVTVDARGEITEGRLWGSRIFGSDQTIVFSAKDAEGRSRDEATVIYPR